MLKSAPYKIRTVGEALGEGYEQVSGFHAPTADPLLETLASMRRKLQWLHTLTPYSRRTYGSWLDGYRSILRYSFIVVDQEDHPEYMQKSLWDRYCFWRRDATRDN